MTPTAPPTLSPASLRMPSFPPARWVSLARLLWLALALLGVSLIGAGLPGYLAALHAACTDPACAHAGWYLSPVGMRQWRDHGLSLNLFAAFVVATQLLSGIAFVAASALIVWRRATGWMAPFTAFFLLTFGLGLTGGTTEQVAAASPGWGAARLAIVVCGEIGISVFVYFFPDGQFRPPWLWGPVLAWCVVWVPGDLFPDTVFAPRRWPGGLEPALLIAFFSCAAGVQLWRYRRVSDAQQRRQTKWALYGIAIVLLGSVSLYPILRIALGRHLGSPAQVVVKGIFYLLFTAIPISLGIAILRHRLWDVDVVINRTIVYGALTTLVVGLYTIIVGGIGALVRGAGVPLAPLLPFFTAAVIAILFQPLRIRLQRRVNRLLYGERDEPYTALARLGQRLESTLTPDDTLPTIVRTVREALRLPYAAILLPGEPGTTVAAASGTPLPTSLRFPLIYGQEPVGTLLLAPRAPGEDFSPADRRLLADLAHQAGVAVHAARLHAETLRLNRALQESRERLVTAREEERRRLRRDLHDGLGPQLAGFTLRLDVATNLLRRDPAAAEEILGDLSARTQAVMADIRRLVYALRPPALDELGLVGALRQHAVGYDHTGVQIAVVAPTGLPPLPAAVEVAAFRITQEALTNVVRHARAHTCTVTLAREQEMASSDGAGSLEVLHLAIRDDGQGIPPDHRPGVGLRSMRERAAELGGRCTIESVVRYGMTVHAYLPLPGVCMQPLEADQAAPEGAVIPADAHESVPQITGASNGAHSHPPRR